MYSASEKDQPSMASNSRVNVMMAATTAMSHARTCTRVTRIRAGTAAGREGPSLWGVERLTA